MLHPCMCGYVYVCMYMCVCVHVWEEELSERNTHRAESKHILQSDSDAVTFLES